MSLSHVAPARGNIPARPRFAPEPRGPITDAEIDRIRELLLEGLERAYAAERAAAAPIGGAR